MIVERHSSYFWKDIAGLTIGLGLLFFLFLGGRPLSSPDEGRYVEIPREMVTSGDYLTPHLDGLKYFEKPPLVYWIEAIPLKLEFTSEFALRFPIALFALFGCLMTYFFTMHFYSRKAGLWAAFILGTSLLYYALSRLILLDLVFTIFMSLGLFSFITGCKEPPENKRRFWLGLSSASLGLAILTKGLAGLCIPLGVIGVWVIALNKWKSLRPLYLPTNLSILLLIVAPWHILMAFENPTFLDFYFIHEHVERYLTTIHRRDQPLWFFLPITLLGFIPWTIFLPRAFRDLLPELKEFKLYDIESFWLIWSGFIFLFFSFSHSKLIPYILPIFPPLAVIVGRFLSYALKIRFNFRWEIIFYAIFCVGLGVGIFYIQSSTVIETNFPPDLLVTYSLIISGLLVFSALGSLLMQFWKGSEAALYFLIFTHLSLLVTLNFGAEYIQKTSVKSLVEKMKKAYPDNLEVVSYRRYYQDLPVYLNHTVKILGWNGELNYGASLNPKNNIILNNVSFKELWESDKNVCLITQNSFYKDLLKDSSMYSILLGTQDDVIVACNRKPTK